MLSSKYKDQRRKYQRAKIEYPVKLMFLGDNHYKKVETEEISYMGFHFFCDQKMAMEILPDGKGNLSRANAVPCTVVVDSNDEEISLAAQIESMSRISQDSFKVVITFDDQTFNFDDYQKYKDFVENRLHL